LVKLKRFVPSPEAPARLIALRDGIFVGKTWLDSCAGFGNDASLPRTAAAGYSDRCDRGLIEPLMVATISFV
jgi:hypothetical protein